MLYRPTYIGGDSEITAEFQRLAAVLNEITEQNFQQVNIEPDRQRTGMVRFADGVDWNPGSGKGLYVYDVDSWVLLSTDIDIKHKTADKSLDTNVTVEDDNHLLNWNLVADTYYKLSGFLKVDTAASATPDIRMAFAVDNAFVEQWVSYTAVTEGAVVSGDSDLLTAEIVIQIAASETSGIALSGFVRTHATLVGNVDFQWAQGTSDAAVTTVQEGSWISFQRMP